MNKIYRYFVEGECEKKLIDSLKIPPYCLIKPGKVEVFNVINKITSKQRLLSLKKNTNIILVYDIDVENISILDKNVEILKKYKFNNIYHIQSIYNFEDELSFSTNLNDINKMYDTNGLSEFKSKFIHQNNLYGKLIELKYDNNKIWSRVNKVNLFSKYSNINDLKIIKL